MAKRQFCVVWQIMAYNHALEYKAADNGIRWVQMLRVKRIRATEDRHRTFQSSPYVFRCCKSPCFRIMLLECHVDGAPGVFLRQQRRVKIRTTDSRRKPADIWPPSTIKSPEPMTVLKHFLTAAYSPGVRVQLLSQTSIRSRYWMTCVG